MKKIILSILVLSTFWANAQNPTIDYDKDIKPLNQKIESLKNENGKLKKQITTLSNDLSKTNVALDSLRSQTQANSNAINQTSQELGLKISTTETNANNKISAVDESLSKNSLYGIIGVLATVLLSGLLYWLLSKRQKSDKSDFIDQLSKTKSSIEESLVKEFGKQTDLMETHLKIIEQQKNAIPTNSNAEPDHSLALKVADEITLIERNVNLMDSKTKGLKQLVASVSKLKDNLAANGYEMPQLLGKPLNRGMHSIPVNTIPDENLEAGVEMITKIIKPQVNFNDKMIQAAQIEVSVGY
jgi:cell division protein FtsB